MTLSEEDAKLFYRIFFRLCDDVNRRTKTVPSLHDIPDQTSLNPQDMIAIADVIFENPGKWIDLYLHSHEKDNPRERSILASWKDSIRSDFTVYRHLKSGTVFIDMKTENAYLITGIISDMDEIFPSYALPLMTRTVLLPFEGKIITDGLYQTFSIVMGPGIRRTLKDTYSQIKAEGRLYQSIDHAVEQKKSESEPQWADDDAHMLYRFTVYPRGMYREVRSVIEISGSKTMADLADLILDAFGFDHEHLYEFCMSDKPYDRYGVTLSDPRYEGCKYAADEAAVAEVDPALKSRFLFHYDFGDDWLFEVRCDEVTLINAMDVERVVSRKGKIEQY